jgi:enoyl-CoA hydratase
MDYINTRFEAQGKICILTINRPEMNNKLSIQAMNELVTALKQAEKDDDCKVVILTGQGDYFCNGGELGDYRKQDSMQIRRFGDSFIALHTTISGLAKPVIAAVQGHALGGGFNLVEACDLAVASEEAEFGVPEINSGLAPMMALTGVIRTLGRKGAMELSLLGTSISAHKAKDIGLVNWVCPKDQVLEQAIETATKLADFNSTAISLCKKLYQQLGAADYMSQMENGLSMLVALLKSEEAGA